jgi:AraC-like DNA-binding protein
MHRYLDMLLARVRPAQSTNMERAVAQVHKELREIQGASRSLSAYAQILGVSPGHLSRCFLAIVGQTYRTERRHIRMQAACRMLRRSQLKISAIALQLGVADPSQFVADFRREFGVTPGQYRRQHYHARPDSWARELSR